MGNLRREVEGKAGEQQHQGAGRSAAPRFQPRRRAVGAGSARCSADATTKQPPSAAGAASPSASRGGSAAPSPVPSEPVAAVLAEAGGDRVSGAPSNVELAWLFRESQRQEEEAQEVTKFLTDLGLDRYAGLILDAPNGHGFSLEALRTAGSQALEELGLPPSPRARLARALEDLSLERRPGSSAAASLAVASAEAPRGATRTTVDGGTSPRPASSASSSAAPPGGGSAAQAAPNGQRWGLLKSIPPGWSVAARPSTGVAPNPKMVDSGCGDGEPLPPEVIADAPPPVQRPSVQRMDPVAAGAAAAAALSAPGRRSAPSTPLLASSGSGGGGQATGSNSRPGTAMSTASSASRPGTSGGEKVCCYECFRQVHVQHVVKVEEEALTSPDTAAANSTRQFCGDACADRFRKALAARGERAKQLVELRSAVLGESGKAAA